MLLLVAALQAPPPDPGAILDRAKAAFDTVRALQADFVQIVANPMVGAPDTTRGVLSEVPPSRFEMRFTAPRGDRIVADGRFLWLYTPSTAPGQVIRTAIPSNGGTGPSLIDQFVDRPKDRYHARWLRADSANDVIELVPVDSGLPYSRATIWVSRGDGLLRRVDLVEAGGQTRSVRLSALRVNGVLPTREFTFAAPSGVRVVAQ